MGLRLKCADIMSCHGYGPVDTGMSNLLRSKRLMNRDDDQGEPGGHHKLQETSPSSLSQSSGENGESMVDGEVSTTNSTPILKIPKSVSFEDSDLRENKNPDTERNSTVAGLPSKSLDGTIRRVKVTHTESE